MSLAKNPRYVVSLTLLTATVFGLPGAVRAELIDDFSDGDDVGWTHFDGLQGTPWGPTIYDASSGRYAMSSTLALPPLDELVPAGAYWTRSATDPSYSNGYVRTLVRADNEATNLASVMRFDFDTGNGYGFGVDVVGDTIFIARVDGGFPTLLAYTTVDLAPQQDYYLEAHVSGPDLPESENISLKLWAAGDPMPADPQLQATDYSYITGSFGLLVLNAPGGPGGRLSGRFDDVHFFIPEPATVLLLALSGVVLARRER
jgi:hypothetical protein